jgi:hypothetical protein
MPLMHGETYREQSENEQGDKEVFHILRDSKIEDGQQRTYIGGQDQDGDAEGHEADAERTGGPASHRLHKKDEEIAAADTNRPLLDDSQAMTCVVIESHARGLQHETEDDSYDKNIADRPFQSCFAASLARPIHHVAPTLDPITVQG